VKGDRGTLEPEIMIDTGSDFNAINSDLADIQRDQKNEAYPDQRASLVVAGGLASDFKKHSKIESKWEIDC